MFASMINHISSYIRLTATTAHHLIHFWSGLCQRDITLRGAHCVVENNCFDLKIAKNANFMHFIKTLSVKPILPVMHCNDPNVK